MKLIQDCGVGLFLGFSKLVFKSKDSKIKLGSAVIRSFSDVGIMGLLV